MFVSAYRQQIDVYFEIQFQDKTIIIHADIYIWFGGTRLTVYGIGNVAWWVYTFYADKYIFIFNVTMELALNKSSI